MYKNDKYKYELLKEYIIAYKKRKIQDKNILDILQEILSDFESRVITNEINEKKKGGETK